MKPRVYLCMPRRGGSAHYGAVAAMYGGCTDGQLEVLPFSYTGSILTHVFNRHWIEAINHQRSHGLTHFAMIHSDVEPERFWLDKLHNELVLTDSGLLSGVVSFKTYDGLTSTATVDPDGTTQAPRRLTLHEIHTILPPTFTEADTSAARLGSVLLVNTGLWICAIQDWCRGVHFRQEDYITEIEGRLAANVRPEDWCFSLDIRKLGVKISATRKVYARHWGETAWGNEDRGSLSIDETWKALSDKGMYREAV